LYTRKKRRTGRIFESKRRLLAVSFRAKVLSFEPKSEREREERERDHIVQKLKKKEIPFHFFLSCFFDSVSL